ncbi:M6 family metalloprotease domain-containing protein [Kribbella deserti]|uniref:M6 family metalloprotease domain-containing protein n=1 Tax=Kribbella deserti TaxID=1926257 RepID=A0ABV6QGE9_9ACTN
MTDERKFRPALRLIAVLAAVSIPSLALATPAPASAPSSASADAVAADPPNPWQFDHWPQTQPWQESRGEKRIASAGFGAAIDPQNWVNPDHMTWSDYKLPPGTNWADPGKSGSVRTFKGALVLVDYPNQPFVVTQPKGSTPFGNPSAEANGIPREQVAEFYRDFLNKPGALNRGHTIHEYWMEDSGGRYGVELTAFGAYKMPGKSHEYAMEFQAGTGCPAGDTCTKNLRTDARAAWVADVGPEVPAGFDFIFYLSAGQDESATWQEFGPMKFPTKEDVTDEFGPPDPALPNWTRTRYVDWTSWASGSTLWPNAGGGSTTQSESSGMAVYAHELSHVLGIGDNYNNPYGVPPRRAYSGIWEMLSRGTFNGPGGPHSRWMIPATGGASMGAQHMLRNKIKLKMIDEQNVLRLSREALAQSGLVIADVTARAIQPGPKGLSGINIELGTGDLAPPCAPATDPMCDGRGYQNYTLEVVDRIGTDSFTPDSGVLLAKTKNQDQAPFEWVIDANPQDIGMTDYVLPDGTKVPITIGDYRQLSDALFHAGTNSGSEFEYVDQANRLHFYVTNVRRDGVGVLSYRVAVRSLDGAGPAQRGVRLLPTAAGPDGDGTTTCKFPLRNTGKTAPVAGQHPEDVSQYLRGDVYRLSVKVDGANWSVALPNELATANVGEQVQVAVQAKPGPTAKPLAKVTLTATSESDPTKKSTATCYAIGR